MVIFSFHNFSGVLQMVYQSDQEVLKPRRGVVVWDVYPKTILNSHRANFRFIFSYFSAV